MPSSSSLPEQPAQPQSDTAVGTSPFDRMEAELKALQQQALATQLSIKRLQTKESPPPYTAILSDLPSVPAIDGTVLSVASILLVALALLWWYLWHRPQTRLLDSDPHSAMPEMAPASPFEPKPERTISRVACAAPSPQPVQTPASSSPFAQQDPAVGFDSEAAASEVIRVRKSLADKREARANLLDREDASNGDGTPSAHAWLDLDISEPPEEPPAAAPAPAMPVDPWLMPGEAQQDAPVPLFDNEINFSLPENESAIEHPMNTDQNSDNDDASPVGHDYTITLALAQESAALELWPEARELAIEVLESDDEALVSQAQDLLERLNQSELDVDPQTPPRDDAR